MKGGVIRSNIRSISISIVPLSAMMAIVTLLIPVCAQTPARPIAASPSAGSSSAGSPRGAEGTQPPSILERQYIMRAIEIEAGKPLTREEKTLALSQIAEDYARIQIINNKMMIAAMSAAVPDYGSVAETTSEIGKRASRIKTNLALPGDDTGDGKGDTVAKTSEYKNVVDPVGLKASLLLLDARIMSFINNPIFANTSVVEVGAAARAKRDLNTIVEFSNRIGRDAKKLSKSSAKSSGQ